MTQAVAAGRWQQGFLIVGLILLVLTIVFGISRRRWNQFVVVEQSHEHSPVSLNAAIKNKKVILQALIFFFYVGAEATVGQWSFTLNSEHRGMPLKVAGAMTVLFWASLTCGRFLMGFLVGKMGSVRLLRLSIGSSLGGALLLTLPFAWTSAVAMMVLGFSLAAIYPLLMSETPHRVGKAFTDHAVGLQVSVAVVGLMVIPSAGGILSEKFGLQVIPFLAVAVIAILLVLNKAVETRS
jgi:fucose permease